MLMNATEEELYFHENYMRSRPGEAESESQSRYRQVCQSLGTCCYVPVLKALASDDVTLASGRLSTNDVLALALALEVIASINRLYWLLVEIDMSLCRKAQKLQPTGWKLM